MKERIARLVGFDQAKNIWMGTFHSIFSKILRIESTSLGYSSNFTIYDTSDSKSVIKATLKELNLDDQIYKVGEVLGRISMAKNNLVTPQGYFANNSIMEQDRAARKPRIADVYRLYCIRCKKADAMDFDDLLLNTNILFRDFPDLLAKYQHMYQRILVDEYQDTNFAQYLIVNKLAAQHKNVTVVGDDSQSIYAFRGAKIENILNFKNDYPNYKLYKLEQNYRSTKNIVDAANTIIAKNKGQIRKTVWSDNETGELIKVIEAATDHEEGFIIANNILDTRLTHHVDYKQFAVLYRTNAQSRIFEESLRKRSIPYKVYGSLSFYQRKEIKDLLAYFRLVVNKKDDEALKRVINYPARGIGNVTIEKIEEYSSVVEKSMWDVVTGDEVHKTGLNKGAIQKVGDFCELINKFSSKLYTDDAYSLAMHIAKTTGLISDLKSENSYESMSRLENVEELLNSISEFADAAKQENGVPTLDKYLENVSLLTDADNEKEGDRDKVSLMTIHAAKGLEFDYVFIAGMEEDLFPSKMALGTPQELEEERRLFYVALTRAGKQAILSYAIHRYKWGVPTICAPSRFLKDIDSKYLELPVSIENNEPADYETDFIDQFTTGNKPKTFEPYKPKPAKKLNEVTPLNLNKKLVNLKTASRHAVSVDEPSSTFDDPAKLKEGMKVYHNQFGEGKVVSIEGVSSNAKALVHFDSAGAKKLLLKFARLRIIE
jgi:DNA helicase II / ATP-dependent DNA helicase PcrA